MKNRFLIDTNIVIYYFNGVIVDNTIHNILKDSFNISIITKIEFLSWNKLLADNTLKQKALDLAIKTLRTVNKCRENQE